MKWNELAHTTRKQIAIWMPSAMNGNRKLGTLLKPIESFDLALILCPRSYLFNRLRDDTTKIKNLNDAHQQIEMHFILDLISYKFKTLRRISSSTITTNERWTKCTQKMNEPNRNEINKKGKRTWKKIHRNDKSQRHFDTFLFHVLFFFASLYDAHFKFFQGGK